MERCRWFVSRKMTGYHLELWSLHYQRGKVYVVSTPRQASLRAMCLYPAIFCTGLMRRRIHCILFLIINQQYLLKSPRVHHVFEHSVTLRSDLINSTHLESQDNDTSRYTCSFVIASTHVYLLDVESQQFLVVTTCHNAFVTQGIFKREVNVHEASEFPAPPNLKITRAAFTDFLKVTCTTLRSLFKSTGCVSDYLVQMLLVSDRIVILILISLAQIEIFLVRTHSGRNDIWRLLIFTCD